MIPNIVRSATLALAVIAIAGCSGNPAALGSGAVPGSDFTASARIVVKVVNYEYSPKTLAIKAGTTVLFVNKDVMTHTVTAFDGSFSSPLIEPGKSWKHTFKKAGKFKYYCQIHPQMRGIVKVDN